MTGEIINICQIIYCLLNVFFHNVIINYQGDMKRLVGYLTDHVICSLKVFLVQFLHIGGHRQRQLVSAGFWGMK